jgi:hypothetical protein
MNLKQQKIHIQRKFFFFLRDQKHSSFLRKLGDTMNFFFLDLRLLKSGFSAACVVRKAWEKVCEFWIEKAMEKSDLNSF